MKKYKAFAIDKRDNVPAILTGTYASKKAFIADIRSNGYRVDSNKVKTAELFDWIMDHTDASPQDWAENKER